MAAGDTKIEVMDEATEAAEAQEFVAGLGAGKEKLASRGSFLKPKVADTTPKKIAGPSDDDNDYGDDEDAADSGSVESGESEESEEKPAPKPAAKAAKESAPATIPDEKLLPDDVALKLVEQILGTAPAQPADLAGASYRVNESRRRAQAAEERAVKAEETLNALMSAVKSGKIQEPKQQEPEEEIDFFADPKAAIDRTLKPHEQQILELKQELENLKLDALRERTYHAESKFAEQNPGYFETIKAYRENFFSELVQKFRGDEERAIEMLQRSDAGIAFLAQQWNEPPWVAFFDHAKRYLAGRGIPAPGTASAAPAAPQPVQKPKVVRRDSSIASARAANVSPSATTLSAGGSSSDNEDVTAATLIEQGPDAARRWIAQHGVRNIGMLIEPLERAERARQNR